MDLVGRLKKVTRALCVSPEQSERILSRKGQQYEQYEEKERLQVVRLCTARLEKYLGSKEGEATQKLFKQVWDCGGTIGPYLENTYWVRWRVFLFRAKYYDYPYLVETIWFGGNGLELYQYRGRGEPETVPVTPHELVTRMSLNTSNRDQVGISRPEQIVPFIRMNAIDLVRFLER